MKIHVFYKAPRKKDISKIKLFLWISIPICTILALILLINIILSSASSKDNNSEAFLHLSDLGGAYSVSENDIDFSLEVSGHLSEGSENETSTEVYYPKTVDNNEQLSNKLLRWGIKRNTGNTLPDADPGTPQLLAKYRGIYIGDTTKKEIYLTFDEGYENGYTPKILDVLKANNVKAVFFITGPYLKEHQDLVKRMVDEGHIVGNHTIHHPSLPSLEEKQIEEEVLGLDRAFNEIFGKNMKYLRPPKGEYSEKTLAITQKLGYRQMFWSFAYDDWYRDKIRGANYALDIVMRNLHNGEVLLLHAVSKDNTEALDSIIKGALEKGYTFGNVNNIK